MERALANVVLKDGYVGETVQILAAPAESKLIEPILLEGRWLVPDDQNAIVINEIFATVINI
jgi:hypothetical protein